MAHSLVRWLKRVGKTVLRNRWVFRLIGLGLFVFVLLRVDLREAVRTLTQVDLRYLALTLVIQFTALGVATVRWQIIMRRLGIHIPWNRSFRHQLIGTSAALITPGQLGEFVKVLYHRKEGFPVAESVLSVVLDRLSDLLLLLLFGVVSLAVLVGIPPLVLTLLAAAGLALLVGGIIFFRNKERSVVWLTNLLARLSPKAYKDVVILNGHRLAERVVGFDRRFITWVALLTAGNFVLLLLRVYATVQAVHMDVPFWYVAMVVPVLRLVGLIPVTVFGIGTRDVTSIYLYGLVGVPASMALVSSALGLFTLQVQTLVGLIVGWRYPLGEKQKSASEASLVKEDAVVTVERKV